MEYIRSWSIWTGLVIQVKVAYTSNTPSWWVSMFSHCRSLLAERLTLLFYTLTSLSISYRLIQYVNKVTTYTTAHNCYRTTRWCALCEYIRSWSIWMGLSVLNYNLATLNVSCTRIQCSDAGEARTLNPSVSNKEVVVS